MTKKRYQEDCVKLVKWKDRSFLIIYRFKVYYIRQMYRTNSFVNII